MRETSGAGTQVAVMITRPAGAAWSVLFMEDRLFIPREGSPSFPAPRGKRDQEKGYLSFRISTMLDVMERMSSIVSSPMWAMRKVLFFRSP